jgi:hypothetical protein
MLPGNQGLRPASQDAQHRDVWDRKGHDVAHNNTTGDFGGKIGWLSVERSIFLVSNRSSKSHL